VAGYDTIITQENFFDYRQGAGREPFKILGLEQRIPAFLLGIALGRRSGAQSNEKHAGRYRRERAMTSHHTTVSRGLTLKRRGALRFHRQAIYLRRIWRVHFDRTLGGVH
jgi:hypothetical protein